MHGFSQRPHCSGRAKRGSIRIVVFLSAINIFFIAGSILTANFSPASAQAVTVDTDCSQYKPNVLGASGECEFKKNDIAHEQEKRLNLDIVSLNRTQQCIKELAVFKQKDPERFKKLPPIKPETACAISDRVPRASSEETARADQAVDAMIAMIRILVADTRETAKRIDTKQATKSELSRTVSNQIGFLYAPGK